MISLNFHAHTRSSSCLTVCYCCPTLSSPLTLYFNLSGIFNLVLTLFHTLSQHSQRPLQLPLPMPRASRAPLQLPLCSPHCVRWFCAFLEHQEHRKTNSTKTKKSTVLPKKPCLLTTRQICWPFGHQAMLLLLPSQIVASVAFSFGLRVSRLLQFVNISIFGFSCSSACCCCCCCLCCCCCRQQFSLPSCCCSCFLFCLQGKLCWLEAGWKWKWWEQSEGEEGFVWDVFVY